MNQIALSQIPGLLARHGMTADIHGDAASHVRAVNTLEDAQAGEISFLSNPKYEKLLQTTRASAVVLKPDVAAPDRLALVRTPDPYAAITALMVALHGYRKHPRPSLAPSRASPARPDAAPALPGVSPSARVGPDSSIHPAAAIDDHASIGRNAIIHAGAHVAQHAVIGDNAVLYPGVYVGPRCRIGNDVLLYPNVVIYEECILGDRVTIHSGTVVGNDGLGYAPVNGRWIKIPQIGIVEIGDDVEIGSNCSIDRATIGRTVIGAGSKFSNLIAIGHGTRIGESCLLVAQVGIAGSVTVGHHVTMAGQAGIVGHVRIGDKSVIGAKAGVTNDVPDGETVLGQPAIPMRDKKREVALIGRLPEIRESVRDHSRRLNELEKKLNGNPPPASGS